MADLESEIRHAVKNGFLGANLFREWDGAKWTCTYRTTESTTVHEVSDADPIEALRKALRSGVRESKSLTKPKPRTSRDLDDLA